MVRPVVLAAVLLCAAAAVSDEPHRWRVVNVHVHDSDTITALDETNTQHRIRLQGIDAPELGQPFGRVACDRLASLAKGKTATIHGHGNDRHGRLLAGVEIEHDDLANRLVAEGLAWHYKRYSDDAGLAAAEPVPRWEWWAGEKRR